MNRQEAYQIAAKELDKIKKLAFSEVKEKVGLKLEKQVHGSSNALYEICLDFEWLENSKESIIVLCKVTDLNWYRFEILEESLVIKAPN